MAKEKVFEEQSQEIKKMVVQAKVIADEREVKEASAVDKALQVLSEKKERAERKIKKERKRKAKVD